MIKFSSILFALCALLTSHGLSAQTQDTTVHQSVEVMPEPPGGVNAFMQWIGKNYQYPHKAIENEVSGRLCVEFVVERDGSLTDIRVLKDLGYGTAKRPYGC